MLQQTIVLNIYPQGAGTYLAGLSSQYLHWGETFFFALLSAEAWNNCSTNYIAAMVTFISYDRAIESWTVNKFSIAWYYYMLLPCNIAVMWCIIWSGIITQI